MADVRQALIEAGWRQGAILQSGPFQHPEALGFLVLNQTCDCINPSFEKEPYLELLPLTPKRGKRGKPDENFIHGKNPREIHFWIEWEGKQTCVVAKIREIELFPRSRHAELVFLNSAKIAPGALDGILAWRADRYLRPAFPDSFENAFTPLKRRFNALLTEGALDALVDSILIQLDHYNELEDPDDCYELEMRLMVSPKVVGQPGDVEKIMQLAEALQSLLNETPAFFEPKCRVVELEKMSLWEARSFLNFSRYDYLSFGESHASGLHLLPDP